MRRVASNFLVPGQRESHLNADLSCSVENILVGSLFSWVSEDLTTLLEGYKTSLVFKYLLKVAYTIQKSMCLSGKGLY